MRLSAFQSRQADAFVSLIEDDSELAEGLRANVPNVTQRGIGHSRVRKFVAA